MKTLREMKGFIQLAGIWDAAEARMLLEHGSDLIGIPLGLLEQKEDITPEHAAEIIREVNLADQAVLITYLKKADEVLKLAGQIGASIIQLHAGIDISEIERIKARRPDIQLIKSLIVGEDNLSELKQIIEKYQPLVDAFITDTYDPSTGRTGATGKTHDWNISKQIVEFSELPVILAGGLNPQNVREAILAVRPAGVDSHSGVEDRFERKDPGLVAAFIKNAKETFRILE
jgi:phosphoribosylanthranilate isomerase